MRAFGVVWPERRHPPHKNDRDRWVGMSDEEREDYRTRRAEMANGNGGRGVGGVTIPTSLLVSILLALFGSGGTLAWKGVTEVPAISHVQDDHDKLTKLVENVQTLKEALAYISSRLDRIEDKSEETNSLVRKNFYGSRQKDMALPADPRP